MDKIYLEELAFFIREHRSNEANFEKLSAKLSEALESSMQEENFHTDLSALKEKGAAYHQAKEAGGNAWPEFEKWASGFEKAVMKAMHT